MNKMVILLLGFYGQSVFSQAIPVSKEAFINAIFGKIADSSFSKYYLLDEANPCSFKRYDYDEWVKYGLRDDISIITMNELAKKSYFDTAHNYWIQAKLRNAICVGDKEAAQILDPVWGLEHDRKITGRKKRKAIRKQLNEWEKKPEQERVVFCFSKPEFTDDLQYAVINVVYRCDDEACGMGATYLFRRKDDSWAIAGKMIAWQN